ncbi:hypothetical protein TcWFU_009754 [Taenia crassiceps]|uniref:Uncharacterized protein n=1 Tax=Taenia crassiceps TaxID=6207 RepID=A0ABR4QIW0_9CEST
MTTWEKKFLQLPYSFASGSVRIHIPVLLAKAVHILCDPAISSLVSKLGSGQCSICSSETRNREVTHKWPLKVLWIYMTNQVEAEGKAEATTPLVSANAPCRGVWLEVAAVLFVGETTILAMREPTPSPCEAENIGSEEEEQCGCFGPRRGCEGGQVSWLRPLVLDVVFLFPPILSLCVCVCVCVCVISGRLEDIGVVVEFPVQQVEAEGKAEATTPLVSANAPCRGVW